MIYIHIKIQDGKDRIDAYFANTMQYILKYYNIENDIVILVELVQALRANCGVNNTIAKMIGIN